MAGVARFVASSLAPAAQRFAPQAAAGVLRQILEIAIDGYQRFPGAERIADTKLERCGDDPQLAIDAVIDQHIRLAGVQGFATGIGEFTQPLAIRLRAFLTCAEQRPRDVEELRVKAAGALQQIVRARIFADDLLRHVRQRAALPRLSGRVGADGHHLRQGRA